MTKIYKDANENHIACVLVYVDDGKVYNDADHENQIYTSDLESAFKNNVVIDVDGSLYKGLEYSEVEGVGTVKYISVVQRLGKNFLDPSKITISGGSTVNINLNKKQFGQARYTFSCSKTVSSIKGEYMDSTYMSINLFNVSNTDHVSFNMPDATVFITVTGSGLTKDDEWQIELGSSATDYEPYGLHDSADIASAVSRPDPS